MSVPDAVAGRVPHAQRDFGREWLRYPLFVALVAVAYYAAAQLVFALEVAGPVAAVVWLPAGVGMAALYLGGLSLWPGVLIADLVVNDYGALPVGTALAQTAGNLVEIVGAVWLLRRFLPAGGPLGSVRGFTITVAALVAGVAVSATIGTLAQLAGGVIDAAAIGTVWRTWWLGDFTAALVLVPLAAVWRRPPPRAWWSERPLEGALLLAAVVALCALVTHSHQPVAYLVFPALVLAALRFGARGATLAVAIATGFTVSNTSRYDGPFVISSVTDSVVNTQLFIAVAALTSFLLAAVVAEREAIGEDLRASRARLVETSDTERRKLVRDLHDGAQQRLSALAVHLRLAAEDAPPPQQTAALIVRAGDELTLAIEELRELAHGLPPALLAKLGLAGAIRSIAARASTPVQLVELPAVRLDDTAEATAYYVIAEAVTNAQRYSHASTIWVSAVVSPHLVEVLVTDDGVGGANEVMSSGLQGLRDRVEAIGGSFELESPRGRGTRVAAAIPAMSADRGFSG
jgi:signal transduction histidine kinase